MKLFCKSEQFTLYHGSMLDITEVIDDNSIDSIVTDPPYELNFMNKGWDNTGIAFQKSTWLKCYEALKPGGYLLAFGGSRTFHRIACAIEDAGFEIRDTIMWLYGSGFPKSLNIGLAIDKKNEIEIKSSYIPNEKNNVYGNKFGGGKTDNNLKAQNEWGGWGTALKPSYEPIIVARKPFPGSLVDNVMKYSVGGINIDECRVGDSGGVEKINIIPNSGSMNCGFGCNGELNDLGKGRFPANTILTYDDTDFDEVCGRFAADNGDTASRYFYCAKASKKDRDEGLSEFEDGNISDGRKAISDRPYLWKETPRKNTHPTVKPTELMQYLIRLVAPPGSTILDPFNGSGSTGKAVMFENREKNKKYHYIGVDLSEEYLEISKARIEYAAREYEPEEVLKVGKENVVQTTLF